MFIVSCGWMVWDTFHIIIPNTSRRKWFSRHERRNLIREFMYFKPCCSILGRRFLWNRFINQDWSGRNFRKVKI